MNRRLNVATDAADELRYAEVDVPPTAIRSVLNLVLKRGHSPERLCRGLGFDPSDLQAPEIRVSYRQTSELVRRAQLVLRDQGIGLAAGLSQTLVSWGLPGLGMLTCRTMGEAIAFATVHQRDAGALLSHQQLVQGQWQVVEATPRFFDPELQPFLVEESFASSVAIVRSLVGQHFNPVRIELAYAKPKHAAAYGAAFNCPIKFDVGVNRLYCDASWMDCEMPSYDRFTSDAIRARLESLMPPRSEHQDLLEGVDLYLQAHLDDPGGVQDLARHLNLSERTLRRRLTELNVSYRTMLDNARLRRAKDMLVRTGRPVAEVALATGFGDARNFRRAFKRWTGQLPGALRQGV